MGRTVTRTRRHGALALGLIALIFATLVGSTGAAGNFTEQWSAGSSSFFSLHNNVTSGVADAGAVDGRVARFTLPTNAAANPDNGPNVRTIGDLYHYGTYETRLKTADCSNDPNAGVINGYFTYFNDGSDHNGNGLPDNSEIDIEWLCAEPYSIWLTMWTDYNPANDNNRRVYRKINMASGVIEYTCYGETFGVCQPLSGVESQPSSVQSIPGYNSSTAFYEYGFTWLANRVTWWIVNPANGQRITLWDYQGPASRIPTRAASYMTNLWRTTAWYPECCPNAIQPPTINKHLLVDWTRYTLPGSNPTATRTNTSLAPTATRTNTITGPTATRTSTTIPGGNLALNKPATASSNETASLTPNLAVDGNAGTRWASAYSDPQWIRVDLGSPASINRVVLRWEAAYGRAYQVQLSNDGTTWNTIYSTTTGDGGVDDLTGLSGSGRYLRVNGTARGTQWGYSLWEIEAYGAAGPTPTRTNTSVAPTATRTNTSTGPTPTRTNTSTGACGTSNAALNRPSSSSSIEGPGFEALRAFDGSTTTRWASLEGVPDIQWLQVDLGGTRSVCRVRLNWEAAYGQAYQIQLADAPGGPWTTIYSTTTGNGGIDDLTNLNGSGRYLRFYGTLRGTPYGFSLWEMEAFVR